jgi:hypothetical protein
MSSGPKERRNTYRPAAAGRLNDATRRDEQHRAGEGYQGSGYGGPMTLMTLMTLCRFLGAIHMARAHTRIYRLKGTKRHKRHHPQCSIENERCDVAGRACHLPLHIVSIGCLVDMDALKSAGLFISL